MSSIRDAVESFAKDIDSDALVLDVGCGLRPYEKYFAQGVYTGIDVPQSGRMDDGKKPDYEFDGVNIPFADCHFDSVLCTEVLEHAVDPDALLKEICRVLKPEGTLFLTVPFMWGLHELPYDFRRFTSEGIRVAVEKAGLKLLKFEKLNSGISAIHMLISSETNNYLNNVVDVATKNSFRFKLSYYIQAKLLRLLFWIWRKNFRFERIYIDNLVVAQK
jgi:SAM-dependent methyltransferase